jgi:flavin reductase (DIM6/NTAB) family NADH-FMN oxidoreductase RutF
MADIQSALDRIPNPVGLVIAGSGDEQRVITVSWFTQVSKHPALLVVSISPNSSVTPLISKERSFVLALLGGAQEEVARTCGHNSEVVNDKFKAANLTLVESTHVKSSCVKEALFNLECRVIQQNMAGDHSLYVAKIESAHKGSEGRQLVFADRDLFSL